LNQSTYTKNTNHVLDFIIRFNLTLFVPAIGSIISDSPHEFDVITRVVSKLRFIQMAVNKYLGVDSKKAPK